jgi:6-phosphofructokinase
MEVKFSEFAGGYAGLIANDFIPLGARDVGRISHLGGTMLGSAWCDEFKTNDGVVLRAVPDAGLLRCDHVDHGKDSKPPSKRHSSNN